MLNTSFTLRPSMDDGDRIELTLRKASECHRISPLGAECSQHSERAFKRQRLFMDRSFSANFATYTPGGVLIVDEPKIRRIPYEFEPPCNEEYWKRRCFRMQAICQETRSRMREMEEDQRQLRRRIQELEKQLLLQSGADRSSSAAVKDVVVQHPQNIPSESSRDGNTIHKNNQHTWDNNKKEGDKGKASSTNKTHPFDCSDKKKPPAILAIPSTQPTSSCFYLTDGEGLSDSELHDGDDMYMEEEEDEDDEDRNDNNFQHRG
jgi:hypothetical protein